MSERTRHVWRWQSEDPFTIVPLVIIIALLVLVPWEGCHPLKSDQEKRVEKHDAAFEKEVRAVKASRRSAREPAAQP